MQSFFFLHIAKHLHVVKQYNKTSIEVNRWFDRHNMNRDYFAHYLRWTYIYRQLRVHATIVDCGCAPDCPLFDVVYRNGFQPEAYYGFDIRRIREGIFANATAFHATGGVDLCQSFEYPRNADVYASLEVVEHLGKHNVEQYLQNIVDAMGADSVLYLSTPNHHDGDSIPNNHMVLNADGEPASGEFMFDEMRDVLTAKLHIVECIGTFASQRDYVPRLDTSQLELFNRAKRFLDPNVLSVMFAPMADPRDARNCLWICRLCRAPSEEICING